MKEKLRHSQVKKNKGSFLLTDLMLKAWLKEVLKTGKDKRRKLRTSGRTKKNTASKITVK